MDMMKTALLAAACLALLVGCDSGHRQASKGDNDNHAAPQAPGQVSLYGLPNSPPSCPSGTRTVDSVKYTGAYVPQTYLHSIGVRTPVFCNDMTDDALVAIGQQLAQQNQNVCTYLTSDHGLSNIPRDVELDFRNKVADRIKDKLVAAAFFQPQRSDMISRAEVVEDMSNAVLVNFCPNS